MLPVLFDLRFDAPLARGLLYAFALTLVAYTAWAGWRGAAADSQRLRRAGVFGAIGAALAAAGLHYALPASAFLGGRGQGLPLHTYSLLLMGGFVAAVWVSSVRVRAEWQGEEGLAMREHVFDLAVWVLVAGLVGARVLFIAVNWRDYAAEPARILAPEGGLVFFGGLLGAMGASFVFTRSRNLDFFRLGDVILPTVSLGQAFGRMGCFSAGCCWGDVAREGGWFAVHFPRGSNAMSSQLSDPRWVNASTGEVFAHEVAGAEPIGAWVAQHGHTLAVHPTQLYEAAGHLLLFGLIALRRYRRFDGQILGAWLIGSGLLRLSVELFRGDLERGTLHGLLFSLGLEGLASAVPAEAWFNVSISQAISLCLVALGAAILLRRGGATAGGGYGVAPTPG